MAYSMKDQIRTLGQLIQVSRDKKAVVAPASHAFAKPKPARFIINLSGATIYRLLQMGIFIYHKEGKEV